MNVLVPLADLEDSGGLSAFFRFDWSVSIEHNWRIKLAVDVCDLAWRWYKKTVKWNGVDRPVSHFSKRFNWPEANYSRAETQTLPSALLQHYTTTSFLSLLIAPEYFSFFFLLDWRFVRFSSDLRNVDLWSITCVWVRRLDYVLCSFSSFGLCTAYIYIYIFCIWVTGMRRSLC